jgi:uncharacterized protein YutE (UPF0331/DUF86 family)
MSPSLVSRRIAMDRIAWIDDMLRAIRSLTFDSMESFISDRRNIWSAESCLRRALEALFDLGRHILAKGFASAVSEYKEIADALGVLGVLDADESRLCRVLAGYRNRIVHLYHEIAVEELYGICAHELDDVKRIRDAFLRWMDRNPERVDETL